MKVGSCNSHNDGVTAKGGGLDPSVSIRRLGLAHSLVTGDTARQGARFAPRRRRPSPSGCYMSPQPSPCPSKLASRRPRMGVFHATGGSSVTLRSPGPPFPQSGTTFLTHTHFNQPAHLASLRGPRFARGQARTAMWARRDAGKTLINAAPQVPEPPCSYPRVRHRLGV